MMTAQPVFLFKPELLFYFSKGMSKSRGDVFSPRRTVQSHLANQVCLFRQGHTVVAEDTQTCPWQQMDGKEESEKNGWDLFKAAKGAGFPHSFLLCWPKTITLDHFTFSNSDAGPQPGILPLRLCSNKIPVFSHPQRRIPGPSEPTVCRGVGRGRR